MGIYNVAAAMSVAPAKLNGNARLTLLVMALLSLDTPMGNHPARLYYGGWQMVCARMGLMPSEDARKRFVRDIATLRRLGIVEIVSPGYKGHAAIYRLLLPVDNLPISGDNPHT